MNKSFINKREIFVVFCSIIAILLITVPEQKFYEPDELCYYFSSTAFSEGNYSLTSEQLEYYRHESQKLSPLWPHDLGYVAFGNKMVLVKAPGFPFYLAFLRFFSLQSLANIFFMLAGVFCIGFLSRVIGGQRVMIVSIVLFLFTPIALIMSYRTYMSDYVSAISLVIGGCILIFNQNSSFSSGRRTLLDAFASFVLGLSLMLRYTNAVAIAILLFWKVLVNIKRYGFFSELKSGLLMFFSFCLPLIGLFAYNDHVFGRFLATGYQLQNIKPQDTTFIFQQLLGGNFYQGVETVMRNIVVLPEILLSGYPWLLLVIPAFFWGWRHLEHKYYIPLTGWFAGICAVFFQYRMLMPHNMVIISRMYLPFLCPAIILVSLYVSHLGNRFLIVLSVVTVAIGLLYYLFFLSLLDVHIFGFQVNSLFGEIRDVHTVLHPESVLP